jgi:hypothetical protein
MRFQMGRTYKAPFPAFDRDRAFRDLAALMASPRPPLALVGAGASVGSGYIAWDGLLKALRDTAMRGDKTDWRRSILDHTDAPWTAEVFAAKLSEGGLGRLIKRHFSSRKALAEPHLSLARMPFPHFLTTNYDPSIEEALDRAGRTHRPIVWPNAGSKEPADLADAEALSEFLMQLSTRDASCRVIYLHGRYDSPEARIILTESDYVARYIASDDARRKLMAIFMTHPVVFIGFSMNDPDLANLMREVTARLRTRTPSHYALMGYKGEADREATRARMEGKFGVRPVFFSRTPAQEGGDEFSNLILLLDALAGKAPAEARAKTSASRRIPFDPDDPNKGRFGLSAEANGRRLSVVKTGGSQAENNLHFQLIVESLPGAPPLADRVVFHLHPSFSNDVVRTTVRAGRATLTRWAYGAFTVGAVADDGATRLELDLAGEPKLPLWFRRQ